MNLYFGLIQPILETKAEKRKKNVIFLEELETWKMASEIFWPLTLSKINEKFQDSTQLLIDLKIMKFYILTYEWFI